MKRVRISVAADGDLRIIARVTAGQWGRKQRDICIRELFATFERLSHSPGMAPQITEIRGGYRKFPVRSHVIYFRSLVGQNIEIIRVLHKRMDVTAHLTPPGKA